MAAAESDASPATQTGVDAREGGRQRARRACDPCKARKRRCDGSYPCSSCTRYEYDCTYTTRRKKRTIKARPAASPPRNEQPPAIPLTDAPDLQLRESLDHHVGINGTPMEANAGVAFPHLLGMKLNPSNAPKVHGFGWNVGSHYQHTRSERSITWIISRADWINLYDVYVREIHCVYGFLNLEHVLTAASKRWDDPKATNADDHVLCGIAALAALFCNDRTDRPERLLADCAKELLDSTSACREPTIHDAEAWVLRTLYLRCNSTPHAAWVASCITLHMIEAAGIHQELAETSVLYPDSEPGVHDLETRRRLFWVAKLLNSWISSEYGRSSTHLQAASCRLPSPLPNDYTTQLLDMYLISEILDPSRSSTSLDFESSLLKVASLEFTLIPLILSQSTLCFAFYRRLRLETVRFKKDLLNEVVAVGRKGLEASRRATRLGLPWWHVSNVPFQFACVLLAMDTQESLLHLSQAITTLKVVVNHFKSAMAHQALATIERLVRLTQIRKQHDIGVLQNCLGNSIVADQPWELENNMRVPGLTDDSLDQWSNDLLWSTPALANVDWEQFGNEIFDFSAPNMLLQ